MARSFWSRRKEAVTIGEDYIEPKQSNIGRYATTLLGILIVGGLLFGVYWGGRWTYGKITDNTNKPTAITQTPKPAPTDSPTTPSTPVNSGSSSAPVTITSSTHTDLPPTPTTTVVASAQTNQSKEIPNTGPGSNLAIFFAISLVFFVGHRIYVRKSS